MLKADSPSTLRKYCLTSCARPNPELSRHAEMACTCRDQADYYLCLLGILTL